MKWSFPYEHSRPILRSVLLAAVFFPFAFSSLWAWTNGDFETGNLTGWNVTFNAGISVIGVPAATIVGPGAAPNTNGSLCPTPSICLNQVKSGNGNWAARIFSGNGDSNHGDWVRIEQGDLVPPSTPFISFWVAAVLEGTHFLRKENYESDAYVQVDILDDTGTSIHSARFSWYDDTGSLVDDGFVDANTDHWKHLPWTQYYWDLSANSGRSVTIRYTAYSCASYGHPALGYLDNAQWLNATQVPTYTPTFTPTPTSTFTPTDTPTPTPTDTPTPTYTDTPCYVGGNTCTFTATPTSTFTDTPTDTPSFTVTPTFTPTSTPTCQFRVWPNPFNPRFAVDQKLKIGCLPPGSKISFYTLAGELVRTLSDTSTIYGSDFTAVWDGTNLKGVPVADGVYFYVVLAGDNKVLQTGKILVLHSG